MLSKKATKIDKIFTVHLTLCSKCQIDGEDFVNFYGLLGKHELYQCIDFGWHLKKFYTLEYYKNPLQSC